MGQGITRNDLDAWGDRFSVTLKDLMAAEKAGNKVVTVGDLSSLIKQEKLDTGNTVNLFMQRPVTRNGQTMPLRDAKANTTAIFDRIHDLLTQHPSEAQGAIGDNPVKRKAIENAALKYVIPRSYGELADRRIVLNNLISQFYSLPGNEQQALLLKFPRIEIWKNEADAIRDLVYPEMDRAAGVPLGTTKTLQEKRGALISLSKVFDEKVGIPAQLHAKSREIAGMPWWKRGSFSTYMSSGGHPGGSMHRMGAMIIKPDPEAEGNRLVASAFGNKLMTKAAKAITTPTGTEIMSMPLRNLFTPGGRLGVHLHLKPQENDGQEDDTQDQDTPGPKSSVQNLRELKKEAEKRRPSAQSAKTETKPYTHIYDPISGTIVTAS
jgi:hypothetical protein